MPCSYRQAWKGPARRRRRFNNSVTVRRTHRTHSTGDRQCEQPAQDATQLKRVDVVRAPWGTSLRPEQETQRRRPRATRGASPHRPR